MSTLSVLAAYQADCDVLFRDDFSDGISNDWNIMSPNTALYSVDSAGLNLTGTATSIWADQTTTCNLFWLNTPVTADGNYTITMGVNSYYPIGNYSQLCLFIFNGLNNYIQYAYMYNEGHSFDVASDTDGWMTRYGDIPFDFGYAPFWMRLVKVGDVYTTYKSQDGVDYDVVVDSFIYDGNIGDKIGFTVQNDGWGDTAHIDYYEVDGIPGPTGGITGNVTFGQLRNPDYTIAPPVNVDFVPNPTGQGQSYSAKVTLDSTGAYSISALAPGTYDIYFSSFGYMRKKLSSVSVIGGVVSKYNVINLLNYDLDGNGTVDLNDFSIIDANFGKTAD